MPLPFVETEHRDPATHAQLHTGLMWTLLGLDDVRPNMTLRIQDEGETYITTVTQDETGAFYVRINGREVELEEACGPHAPAVLVVS